MTDKQILQMVIALSVASLIIHSTLCHNPNCQRNAK